MSLKLLIGVNEVAYSDGDAVTTTYKVASILEAKYGLFSAFYEHYKSEIADIISTDLAHQIELMMNGAPVRMGQGTFTYGADQKILGLFKRFILAQEHNLVVAAQAQQGSRFKSPTAKGAGKPAFVDTGLLLASLAIWTKSDAVSE